MKTTLKTIGIAFLGGSLALAGYSYIAPNKEIIIQKTETPILAQPVNIPSDSDGNVLDFKYAANKSLNSVVHINTESKKRQLSAIQAKD